MMGCFFKMSNYTKLFNNSLIFAIGSLGTKLIIFFLVPLYTYYLTTSEFGMVDLFTTTTTLLIPIFTLSIFDSVFRFVMDKNYDKQAVLINSVVVIIVGFTLLLLIYPILINILPFGDFIFYFYLLLLVQTINTTLNQFIRAKGLVRLFAINGIINALIILICNILFLVIYQFGITGYLISLIIANVGSSLFVFIGGKIRQDFNTKKISIKLMKEMLLYSIPLIPNSLMWWIMSLSDRYMIIFYIGLSANGLYAIATKVPSVLNILNSIFFQAWQMSAIEETESKGKSLFYSNVFNIFSMVMLVSTSLLLAHIKFVFELILADNYIESWRYVPFLLLATVFASFSGFLGVNYIAAKKTSGVFKTSVIGAIINIVANIILIPQIGINGAAMGTMLSFAVVWLLRIKDTKKYVNISFNVRKLLLNLIIISVQISILFMNLTFEYSVQLVLLIVIMLINLNEIKIVKEKVFSVIYKQKSVK